MIDKVRKSPKKSVAKKLRNTKIREMAISGSTIGEIAEAIGMEERQIGRILSNDETKQLIQSLENEIKLMGTEAVRTLYDSLTMRKEFQMMGHAVKTATSVLKSIGAMRDRLDLNHSFPDPHVITLMDGGQIIIKGKTDKPEEKSE